MKSPENPQNPERNLRSDAASVLGKIGYKDSVSCLLEALHDKNFLCSYAALALGEIGDARAGEPLTRVLCDREKLWVPHGAAAVALATWGNFPNQHYLF